ncbi:hypothetical protein [Clostridium botulinum]|uniref:hypothetical protein n=1 Tax=Clostridium botulinum TaxID=1491 RepID=UPI001C9BB13F|nr:hypothetical protein [Clostridium botulinum]MBY6811661.1 hypothetical protein [Clostridium botulinum]MBY6835472.1 hypothetical protein [Clostridium botulinum]MBY6973869.1 hypothetical protein [Clostridium botulinum]
MEWLSLDWWNNSPYIPSLSSSAKILLSFDLSMFTSSIPSLFFSVFLFAFAFGDGFFDGIFFTRSSSFFSGRGFEGGVGGVIFDKKVLYSSLKLFPFFFLYFFHQKRAKTLCLNS